MKKRVFFILMICVTVLVLTGCGKISKEKMLQKSTTLSLKTLRSDISSNYKNAVDKYEGNIYTIVGGVISIEDKFAKIEYYSIDHVNSYLEVHFSDEDLKKLVSGQKIEFVGKISKIDKTEKNDYIVIVENAYIVSDIIEITGVFNPFSGNTYNGYTCIHFLYDKSDSNQTITYRLDEVVKPESSCNNASINGTEIHYGDTITVRGKIIKTKNDTAYDDDWTFTSVESVSVKK